MSNRINMVAFCSIRIVSPSTNFPLIFRTYTYTEIYMLCFDYFKKAHLLFAICISLFFFLSMHLFTFQYQSNTHCICILHVHLRQDIVIFWTIMSLWAVQKVLLEKATQSNITIAAIHLTTFMWFFIHMIAVPKRVKHRDMENIFYFRIKCINL